MSGHYNLKGESDLRAVIVTGTEPGNGRTLTSAWF
jgi:hypothetical protein